MNIAKFRINPGDKVKLKDHDPAYTDCFKKKKDARKKLADDIKEMAKLQDQFYAANSHALLIVLQALDAAGKDGAIKHVMSGINPQGCKVVSFKAPSEEELNHNYLWRCIRKMPERGRIGVFNRSYYEEVLIVRVHPEFLEAQKIPEELKGPDIWERRFQEINEMERYLDRNGTRVLKFFLNLSKEEQKNRFLRRIRRPDKNWKLSTADVKERGYWDNYQRAYEDMLTKTSTEWAPWHVIPADKKWFSRAAISEIIVTALRDINPQYPEVSDDHRKRLAQAKKNLLAEKD